MYNILAVDDEPEVLLMYKKMLNMRREYAVLNTATDGREAVEKYMNNGGKFDLVIMDHKMPVMDGLQATRKIMTPDPDAKIKFVSADISVKDAALDAGAIDFIKKPVNVKALLRSIDEVLNR